MTSPSQLPYAPADAATAPVGETPPRVLLQDIEPAMADLIGAWLCLDGLHVQREARAGQTIALILIDLPFPRRDGAACLRLLAQQWPGVPVLVLSSTFFAGVATQGEVASQLGAAAVLAAPVADWSGPRIALLGGLFISAITALAAYDIVRGYQVAEELAAEIVTVIQAAFAQP